MHPSYLYPAASLMPSSSHQPGPGPAQNAVSVQSNYMNGAMTCLTHTATRDMDYQAILIFGTAYRRNWRGSKVVVGLEMSFGSV